MKTIIQLPSTNVRTTEENNRLLDWLMLRDKLSQAQTMDKALPLLTKVHKPHQLPKQRKSLSDYYAAAKKQAVVLLVVCLLAAPAWAGMNVDRKDFFPNCSVSTQVDPDARNAVDRRHHMLLCAATDPDSESRSKFFFTVHPDAPYNPMRMYVAYDSPLAGNVTGESFISLHVVGQEAHILPHMKNRTFILSDITQINDLRILRQLLDEMANGKVLVYAIGPHQKVDMIPMGGVCEAIAELKQRVKRDRPKRFPSGSDSLFQPEYGKPKVKTSCE